MAAETIPPAAVEDDCGAGPEAFDEDERLRVVCPDWGRRHTDRDLPPAGGGTSGAVVAGPTRPVPPEG